MAVDVAPIHVGVVYLETDYLESDADTGGDSRGDRFILSFTGGAADTTLTELRIRTDKDGDGISVGDPIYDTTAGGRGKGGHHDFQIVRLFTADGRDATATAEVTGDVDDGGQELVLRFSNFRAGDRLEFSIDVDEVLRNVVDLDIFNDRLDVITSGQEFQDSILEATFEAPHFESASADALFVNDFGDPASVFGLDLPPDDSDNIDSRPNRSAAAVGSTDQTPKPIEIGGTVWIDNNLDLIRQPGEVALPGVELVLFQLQSDGRYVSTGHRATTDADGAYRFGKSLDLAPGTYRVVETQPDGFFSVGSVPGQIVGSPGSPNFQPVASGFAESPDVLSGIEFVSGDTSGLNYDFAEAAPASIAGNVYVDADQDAVFDRSIESGISGVTIRLVAVDTIAPLSGSLSGSQGNLTTTTDADGVYKFDNLPPGTYEVVEVTQPADYTDGVDTAGTVDGQTRGTANNPGDSITAIELLGDDDGVEYNFGEFPLGSIAGFVYLAAPGEDCDGVFHDDDTPIAGALITLIDDAGSTVATTTTGTDGSYFFGDIPVGNYTIREQTPAGLLDGGAHPGRVASVTMASSTIGRASGPSTITDLMLPAGAAATQYNFCEAAPASVSGYVYVDDSDDGVRDAGESPIAGVEVALYDLATGFRAGQTVTDADGYYEFASILPGDYRIVQTQPEGFYDGRDTVGMVDGVTTGAIDGNDRLSTTLRQGQTGVEYNFGELRGASLSGRVHLDDDGDCVLDPGETLLSGVTVRLLGRDDVILATAVTDALGAYRFENIPPGTYTVVEGEVPGTFDGDASVGTAGGVRENANRIGEITLASGEVAVAYDFCEQPPAEISGVVFADANGDCLFDPGETSLSGVVVELFDDAGNLVATTTTGADGTYRFSNLPGGSYTLRETQPAGYLHGGQMAGTGSSVAGGRGDDSVADVISGVTIGFGDRLVNYNFCEIEPASIRGVVHVDNDGDCIRDEGERGIAGVTITLRDESNNVVATTVTDADGAYEFVGLPPGQYTITESQPDGFFQGGQRPGTGDGWTVADDVLGLNLIAGQDLIDYDFCEVEPAALSGYVHIDDDGDCFRDATESGVAGVTITLRDELGNVVDTTTTDADGRYEFVGLRPGEYSIAESQPPGLFQGGQVAGTGDGWVIDTDVLGVHLGGGQTLVDYNFCELPPASLAGNVWADRNTDGVFDPTEDPIPGVLIELIDADGRVVATDPTAADGSYEFENLRPGTYAIRETQPRGYFHGGQIVGSLGGNVGQDDLVVNITVGGGDAGVRYDFPEVPPAMIAGYVFQDGNAILSSDPIPPEDLRQFRDGLRTADDVPLAGVQIELRNLLGFPVDASRALPSTYATGPIMVTTDADGYYEFTGLRPGTYHVYESQPDGLIDGLDTAGSTGGLAINRADQIDGDGQIVIQTLSSSVLTDPRDDAILNVSLLPGSASVNNNFSEIAIEALPDDPPPIQQIDRLRPPPSPLPPVIVQTFPATLQLVSFAVPDRPTPPPRYYDDFDMSWHLSVINGGYPGGDDTAGEAKAGVVRRDGTVQTIGYRTNVRNVSGSSATSSSGRWSGTHNNGRWRVWSTSGESLTPDDSLWLGQEDAVPMTGDFDGDGVDEAVIFVGGDWFVDFDGDGAWDRGDLWIRLGNELDRPVVGDWDGDGKDDVGIFGRQWQRDAARIKQDPGLPDPANQRRRHVAGDPAVAEIRGAKDRNERWLRRGNDGSLRADAVDHVFRYGEAADVPIAGDWNGDGIDQIGIFRGGRWTLDADGDGRFSPRDTRVTFGRRGDEPVVGDFDGDGIDDLAVVRGNTWIIDTDGDGRITGNDQQITLPRDASDTQPIVGDFDGDGRDDIGYYRRAG